MRPQSPIQSPRFGRTAAIAAAILAAVAVFQLGAVTVAFFRKSGAAGTENGEDIAHHPPMKIDVTKLVAESPPPDDPAALGVDPLLPGNEDRLPGPRPILPHAEPFIPAGENGASQIRTGAPPRPTPVPLSMFTPKTDPRFGELLEQGILLRDSGDTAGALVKLREASVLEPGNARAIAEQAYTFEKMSLPEKAAEQWKRIVMMGERAGLYYAVAMSKMNMAVQGTMRTATGGGPEIAKGKVLAIGGIALADEEDAGAAKKFAMTVPVRASTSEAVAVREMKVFVLFYERMNGKEITKTSANVSNRWTSAPVDWKDGGTETLQVNYELPVQQARTEHREYYGYIVRLYYRGELQDTKAEPITLNQKFPAPYILSE